MSDQARVLIITGDGKSKTTAALGMALRAVGHGLRVCVIQFIKNDPNTGELAALARLGVEVTQAGSGFVPSADAPQFAEHQRAAAETLELASAAISSGETDMLILDEICTAVAKGLLGEDDVLSLLQRAETGKIVVLTGRGATERLIAKADTVSEIRCVKHGYQAGIAAQKGVEL